MELPSNHEIKTEVMRMNKVIIFGGLSLNLADVKCFRLSNFSGIGKRNTMTVEFKTRYDFILHPGSGEYEKQEFNETVEQEFPDYDTAKSYFEGWIDFWREYLDELN